MHLDNEDIRRVAESVWTTTLGLDLSPAGHNVARSEEQEFLTGCVQIVGGWQGATALHISTQLARKAASIMFGCDEPHSEEVWDALGELVNMTGGNIKSLLPGPCTLSLPCIVEGKNYHLSVPGSEVLNRVLFECQGEPLEVLLMEKNTSLHDLPKLELGKSL